MSIRWTLPGPLAKGSPPHYESGRPLRLFVIDSFEQHQELASLEHHAILVAVEGPCGAKVSQLESLVVQPESIPIKDEDFQTIAHSIEEEKQIAAGRVPPEVLAQKEGGDAICFPLYAIAGHLLTCLEE